MKNVQDAYPLSPMQQGMLFHSLYAERAGAYVEQIGWTLEGHFDERAFADAWRRVVERHPVLRTAFFWEGLEVPLQVVRQRVELEPERHDWSRLDEAERERRFAELLEDDRRRGFELTKAPLLRLHQIRVAPGRHRFVWSYHHALIDGWSAPLVLREVFLFYQAFARGRELELEKVRPFRDYVAWAKGRDAAATEAYWRETLAGFTEPTPLPLARPAVEEGPPEGTVYRTERRRLPAAATAALERLARDRQLTVNTLLQGAWGLLLGRLTDADDVVFGGVVSGRPTALPGVDAMVGPFVNTLPVRLRLPDEEPAVEWLRRLHDDQLALREHEHSPLLRVREWSELPAGAPLFETLIVYENLPADGGLPELEGGPRVTGSFRSDPRTGYPLSAEVFPGDELDVHLTYDVARFEATAVRRLLRHYTRLLRALAEAPERPVGELSVLAPAERHQLLVEWGEGGDLEADIESATVPERFAEQARRSPSATAVVAGGAELGYGELETRANRLAHRLRALGVKAETPVGVFLDRSPELVVALLGVWKAGGAYLPLDPAHPDARLAFLLEDAAGDAATPLVVVTGTGDGRIARVAAEAGLAPPATVALRGSEAEAEALATLPGDPPEPPPAPGDLAYLIYTSGTTGRPKGVAVEHRQLSAVLATAGRHFDFRAGDRMPCLALASFDVFLFELLAPLLAGGTSVLMDLRPAPDLELLAGVLAECSHLHAVPSLMRRIVEEVERRRGAGADFRHLRQLFVGGDAVPPELLAAMARAFPAARVRVLYGPTEGTIFCAHHPLPGRPEEVRGAPIGRPLPGVRLELRDRRGEPVPIGVAGEIQIGGAGVARGYLRRDELTAERFPRRDGERWYRTGDLARWSPGGHLEFLGRADDQVKVRGFRVELGEVAAVLAEHPSVGGAVAVVREDRPGDPRLVAYATVATGVEEATSGAPSEAELRDHLRRRLPEPLLPAAIVVLDHLPLDSRGKVDRRALPAPPDGADAGDALHRPPRTPLEELVAASFAELLGRERVGADQSFFELGGHSLLATQLVSRLRGQLEVELPLRDLFEHPTAASLAGHVEALRRRRRGPSPPPLVPADRSRPLPLSFAQQRLWLVDQLQPGSSAYNVPIALRIGGDLDPHLLARTLTALSARHEALRTTFADGDGGPVQVVAPPRPVRPPLVDLSALPDAHRDAEEERRLREEMWRPFDLATGPLFRAFLLRLAERRHLLVLDLHHAISDGWSVDVVTREVSALYGAFADGTEPRLPALPIQYPDFAAWQRSWLTGELLEAEIAYWRGALGDSPEPLELPTDRPRRPLAAPRGDLVPVHLGRCAPALRELARGRGATPFMALFTVFTALLHRATGQPAVTVGTPVSGRNRREVEPLVGFFVNTLVIPSRLAGDPPLEELLEAARGAVLGAFEHQEVPFEKLVEELQPERDLTRNPLFQVVFTFQERRPGTAGLEVAGLDFESLELGETEAKFELILDLRQEGEEVLGTLSYNAELYDRTTALRLARHYQLLAAQLLEGPGRRLSELPFLTPGERQQVVVEWNDTATPYPRDASIPAVFAAVARAHPDAPALEFGDRRWSYRQLRDRSRGLAAELRERGVGTETVVGVCLRSSPEMVAAVLAVLEAGGAYLPLDPDYPEERLAFMAGDAGLELVLTDPELAERLPENAGGRPLERLVVDPERWRGDGGAEAADDATADGDVAVDPEQLAYVTYTSGSTGRPKGIAVPHRAVLRLVLDTDFAQLGPGDRVAQVANVTFDAATFEFWGALLTGGTLVGVPRPVVLAPAELGRALVESRITAMFLTVALFNQVVQESPESFAGVRHLLVGGEAVEPRWARHLLERGGVDGPFPGRLINGYGPTENTTFSACHPIRRVPAGARSVPIGRPIANSTGYVVDRWQSPVPVGVRGELLVGGDGLARGYHRRPALTAERFVPAPGGEPGARLYRTGDRVRRLPGGELDYLGRFDQQVKLRGFRIELGEVEAVLAGHPAVKDAVAIIREERAGDRRLVAYAVAHATAHGDPGEPAEAELRSYLRERLPEYMVPAAVVALDALPLSAHGKLDRRALPAPAGSRGGDEYVAPRSPEEERMAEIFARVLELDRVGVTDDFFELGGHSLLATRLTSRVREELAVELPLSDLFERPTPAALALRVAAVRRGGAAAEAPPIEPADRDRNLPLSFAQQRLWLIDQLRPGNPAYNVPFALRMRGELRPEVLERTFTEIVARHESLRTTFDWFLGVASQQIDDPTPFPLPEVDLTALPAERREAEGRRLAAAEARAPFDLAFGPLFRVTLVRLGDAHHLLLANMHHIVSDGWSIGVMVEEISALYRAFAARRSSPLPPLPVQYVDYAVWQRQWLQGAVLDAELDYWKRLLGPSPEPLEIPTDRPRPKLQSFRAGGRPLRLPGGAAALRPLLRRAGVTPFIALMAVFHLLLHRYSGQAAIRVGTPVSGRNRKEIEGLIGFFVNTLVVQVEVDAGDDDDGDRDAPTFTRLLDRVREAVLGAFDHQELPFEKLVEELQPERDTGRQPLFQAFFTYLAEEQAAPELPGLAIEPLADEAPESKFDLALSVTEVADDLVGSLDYQADLFDATTMARVARHFEALVWGVIADPERPISELPLLDAAERHQLVVEWGDRRWRLTGADAATDAAAWTPAWRRFAAQAERTPEATALVAGDRELSYADLDRWSNRIAHHLRRHGVGRGTVVGLCLGRDAALVAGLLGVWKAGGAYLPLDPSYPDARLRFLVEDALVSDNGDGDGGPPRVLTTGALVERLREAAPESVEPVLVEEAGDEASADAEAPPDTDTVATDLAYLIYTSGTTGRPKGVMVEQRNLAAFLDATRAELCVEVDGDDEAAAGRMPLVAPVSFDIFLFELLTPLLAGGTSVLLGLDPTLDLDQLVEELAGASQLHAVPSVMRRVVDAVHERGGDRWGGVRRLFVGGDKVPAELLGDLRDTFPGATVRVLYGPTEATILAASHRVPAAGEVCGTPLGRPLPGVAVELRDPRGSLVPAGVAGEIHLGGDGVTRGYLGREELTADRYPERGGRRWYRTGDRARWLPGGVLEFLGRVDEQVKVRGFRIELGEIESVLAEHPAVATAAAAVREGADGEPRLAGYVVRAGDRPLLEDELLDHLRGRLPGYMVPSSILELGELPLTAHGKVDRKALPDPEAGAKGQYVAPRNPTEERLAKLWLQLVPAERVGVHDNFFKLGGHSLLATQLVSRIRQELSVELPLKEIFEVPTIAGLARAVERARAGGPAIETPPLEPVPRDGDLPLSFAQQRLWFIDQLDPGSPAYNLPYFIGLDGRLDLGALEHAIDGIVARHEVLRTTFVAEEGKDPVQRIGPPEHRPLPLVDLSALPAEPRQGETRRLAFREMARSFDLTRGPVVQVTVVRRGAEDHLAMLNMHHIVSDAWSLEVFIGELRALYTARVRGEEPELPELPVQYADFAVWQRRWLRGEVIDRLLDYWKRELAGELPVLELPTDRPRPAVRSFRGGIVTASYGRDAHRSLIELGQREGTTLYMTLLAAFQAFLSRLTGQDDLVVGTALAGRGQPEIANLIGFFINMLPIRADLAGDPSFVELLRRGREKVLGAFGHQDLPLDRLIEELRPERRGSHMPLFQVAFGLRAAFRQELELSGLEIRPESFDYDTARLDLSLWMLESEDGLSATWFYSTDVFDRATVERLSRRFATFLDSLCDDPEAWISTREVVDPEEREALEEEQAKGLKSRFSKLRKTRRKAIAVPQETER